VATEETTNIDFIYDLASVLHQPLKGITDYRKLIQAPEGTVPDDVVSLFRRIVDEDEVRAQDSLNLLCRYGIPTTGGPTGPQKPFGGHS
jgi:hypothetical protein